MTAIDTQKLRELVRRLHMQSGQIQKSNAHDTSYCLGWRGATNTYAIELLQEIDKDAREKWHASEFGEARDEALTDAAISTIELRNMRDIDNLERVHALGITGVDNAPDPSAVVSDARMALSQLIAHARLAARLLAERAHPETAKMLEATAAHAADLFGFRWREESAAPTERRTCTACDTPMMLDHSVCFSDECTRARAAEPPAADGGIQVTAACIDCGRPCDIERDPLRCLVCQLDADIAERGKRLITKPYPICEREGCEAEAVADSGDGRMLCGEHHNAEVARAWEAANANSARLSFTPTHGGMLITKEPRK